MKLDKKKVIAAKALKVGKNRVIFNTESLAEIKEAITKQDIKELYAEGIISIRPVKGRKKIVRRKTRRGPGKIKKTVSTRKQDYVKLTRKLREYLKHLKEHGKLEREDYKDLRKKIRMKNFKSKAHLKEQLKSLDILKEVVASSDKSESKKDAKQNSVKKKAVKKTKENKK